jgi:FlaA1/EpsC-like NDP-sugar epimerase
VTVTHPEMTRYFMTIPEAASLVVQAGSIGGRGDVFVLDMGEAVRIIDLAMQMIRLSGKEPERDIDIDVVGARPGEKLHEELWGEGETAVATSHPKIMRVSGPIVDSQWLDEELTELDRLVGEGETLEVVSRLSVMMRTPQLTGSREPVRWEEEDTLSGQKLT